MEVKYYVAFDFNRMRTNFSLKNAPLTSKNEVFCFYFRFWKSVDTIFHLKIGPIKRFESFDPIKNRDTGIFCTIFNGHGYNSISVHPYFIDASTKLNANQFNFVIAT